MKKSITQRKTVKTGISISGDLAREADVLARELGVSRSALYAMAVQEFIRRRETLGLLRDINKAYGGEADPEDEALIEDIKRKARPLIDEDER